MELTNYIDQIDTLQATFKGMTTEQALSKMASILLDAISYKTTQFGIASFAEREDWSTYKEAHEALAACARGDFSNVWTVRHKLLDLNVDTFNKAFTTGERKFADDPSGKRWSAYVLAKSYERALTAVMRGNFDWAKESISELNFNH